MLWTARFVFLFLFWQFNVKFDHQQQEPPIPSIDYQPNSCWKDFINDRKSETTRDHRKPSNKIIYSCSNMH
jgi:hypothetical protein